jgi:hypothetical protein
MGFLSRLFQGSKKRQPTQLAGGSYTIDSNGKVISSTLPGTFPRETMDQLSRAMLNALRSSQMAQLRIEEFTVHYPGFKITARVLRSGAIIFLVPRPHANHKPSTPH